MKKSIPATFILVGIIAFVGMQIPKNIFSSIKKEAKERPEKFESKTEALDALQFLSASYAFPNKDIPADAFGKAYDFYKQNYLSKRKMDMVGLWQNIGPVNCGGRTLCVALSPSDTSTIWLGSASGGLWKSTTGGIGAAAWTYVPTGFPTLGVSTIAFQPGNSQTMIIGTGETYAYGVSTNGLIDRTTRGTFGIGILKTTDGGNTWSQVLNWTYQQNRGVWDVKFNPLKPSIVYAATTDGIYKSFDAGNTWTQVSTVQMAMNLVIDPVDTNIVYCGVGNLSSPNKGVYQTTNSGASWNVLANGLPSNTGRTGRIILAINPMNHKTVLAHLCNMYNSQSFYISYNEGASWVAKSPQDIASWQGWYAKGLLFKSNDTTKVLAGGVDMHYSTDEGNNFSQVSNVNWNTDYEHADIHDIISNPLAPNKIYTATDGGLFRSNDFGVSYYECTGSYVTTQFYIGAVSAQDGNMALVGAQDNYTWQYTGTTTWVSQIGGDGCYAAIDPSNDNNQFGAYQFLNVYKSTDRGVNFNTQVITSPASASGGNSTAFLAPYLICPSNPQVMYAGGDSVIKSTDGGNTWNMVSPKPLDNTNIILSMAVSATNKDSLYVATAPTSTTMHVFISTNGGTSYTDITGSLPNRYPRRIAVDPKDSKTVYIVFSGFGTGHIFKSTNAGGSWTDVSTSLPDVPFHCVTVDPFNHNIVFAGCDLGIFYSSNGGSTWNTFNAGMPEAVMIFDLVVSPSDNTLVACTHGHGVYKRSLADATGVNELADSNLQFSVYPNPSSDGTFTVSCSQSQIKSIDIYDLDGKIVFHKAVNNKQELIDLNEVNGIYFVAVKTDNGIGSKKIILNK
ncbi:MAG TPA: T9SS type A sorting domain-containing protein [Bacteroidia bacterium]